MTVVRGPRSHAGHEPGAQRASAAAGLSIPAKAGKENPDGGYWPGQPSNVGPAWQLQCLVNTLLPEGEWNSPKRGLRAGDRAVVGCGRPVSCRARWTMWAVARRSRAVQPST